MICFHHNDADGRCAGAIVRKYINEYFPNTLQKYVEVDYDQHDVIPDVGIRKYETIYIVDFHFSVRVMEWMSEITSRIYVFDHHKTGAEITAQYPKEVECHCDPGSELAGCELVWNYLYPTTPMPAAVTLIGDRDAWKWKYGKQTAQFNEGLKLHSRQPQDIIWDKLLNSDIGVTASIQAAGEICLRYRDSICKEFRSSWGYEVNFADHLCYVMNLRLIGIGSEMFAEKLDEYDMCIGMVFQGTGWKISLKSKGKVDVSEIAKKFPGGGGHRNAAGFSVPELPFRIVE